MDELTFKMPTGMTPDAVAQYLNAYLLGAAACQNTPDSDGKPRLGPFSTDSSGLNWQLDAGNDYFLHVEGDMARLNTRYKGRQDDVARAMIALFLLRCGRRD